MERLAATPLLDLLPAAEAVREDERVGRGGSHPRQKHPFPGRHGDAIGSLCEAEGTSHPTAAGRQDLVIETEAVEEAPLAVGSDDRVLVTVDLNQRLLAILKI